MTTSHDALAGNLRVLPTQPLNPKEGEMFFNSTTNRIERYDGSAWKSAATNTTTSTSTTTTSTSTTTS